jgi:hypothetical protein
VEGVLEGYDRGAARVVAGDLGRVLDRFGPRVDEEGALLRITRHQSVQLLGQLQITLVFGDVEAGVGELVGLLLYRLDHPGVRVPHIQDTDATTEVDKRVAVDVGEEGALRLLREHRRRDADA